MSWLAWKTSVYVSCCICRMRTESSGISFLLHGVLFASLLVRMMDRRVQRMADRRSKGAIHPRIADHRKIQPLVPRLGANVVFDLSRREKPIILVEIEGSARVRCLQLEEETRHEHGRDPVRGTRRPPRSQIDIKAREGAPPRNGKRRFWEEQYVRFCELWREAEWVGEDLG